MTEIKHRINESDLVRALKEHDPRTFAVLYKMYAGSVKGIISRIIHNTGAEEDLVQETMIKIWNSAHHYDASKGRLFTWILNVARNSAIDFSRSKNVRLKRITHDISDHLRVIDCAQSMKANPDQIGLRELAAKLKPELYEAINIVFFKGYTHPEAAEELQIPLGTLKTRIRTALIEFRKVFRYYNPDKGLKNFSLNSYRDKKFAGISQETNVTLPPETNILNNTDYGQEWNYYVSNACNKSFTHAQHINKQNIRIQRDSRSNGICPEVVTTNFYQNL